MALLGCVLAMALGVRVGRADESADQSESTRASVWSSQIDAQGVAQIELHLDRLPALARRSVTTWPANDPRWSKLIKLQVGATPDAKRVGMLGETQVPGELVVFVPRFPLRPALTYCASIDTSLFSGDEQVAWRQVQPLVLERTASKSVQPTRVTAVYPSADVLPENLLRFYVHFSGPMRRGSVYDHVQLLNESGAAVDLPFLEIAEELWSADGKRITLLFDPGRIKRGLKPREEHGPILEEGHRYTLAIDAQWCDAAGRPLAEKFTKQFSVTAPDSQQPATERWTIAAPAANTQDPLTVHFDEPLDEAMLQRVLTVVDSANQPVPGAIKVTAHETSWTFHPTANWNSGQYSLKIDTVLEDVAGNSLRRPFELDVFREIQTQVTSESTRIPFEVTLP
jgi:hypothetical protein